MKALVWFWVLLLALAGSGAVILEGMGPVPHTVPVVAVQPPSSPPVTGTADQPIRISEALPGLLDGALPRIGADGRRAMDVYARPFDQGDTRPRIVLVLVGLGLPSFSGPEMINALPSGITLAVSPVGGEVSSLLDQARQRGDELLVSIPMQAGVDQQDRPGLTERELRADLPPDLNNFRLAAALSRFTGYVGATGATDGLRGERYAASPQRLAALGRSLADRGLLYLDPRPGAAPLTGVPYRAVDLILDDPPGRAEIEAKLAQLERLAREHGSAIGLAGPPRPALLERLTAWTGSLAGRGLVLAPLSAVISPAARPKVP